MHEEEGSRYKKGGLVKVTIFSLLHSLYQIVGSVGIPQLQVFGRRGGQLFSTCMFLLPRKVGLVPASRDRVQPNTMCGTREYVVVLGALAPTRMMDQH